MTLFVYENETMRVVARITGNDYGAIERIRSERYGDTDHYSATYTPAFGAVDGLIDTENAEDIDADTVKYEIQTRSSRFPDWSNDMIGDPNEFDSVEEAETAIEELKRLGDESWRTAEYRVVAIKDRPQA